MPDVPAIPPLTPLDANTQRVLKPLVDGWELRNGASDKAFITAKDAQKLVQKPVDVTEIEHRVDKIESDEWFRAKYDEYLKDQGIVDMSTGQSISSGTQINSNATAYASDGTANGLTIDIPAGATVFMNGSLTLRREYNPYEWVTIVTDVGPPQVKRDILTITGGDWVNGGWLFCWIDVTNLDTGQVTSYGRSLVSPHMAVFLKAYVHGVATCSVGGRYHFRVNADGSHAVYGFGDIKDTKRVPLSVVVCK